MRIARLTFRRRARFDFRRPIVHVGELPGSSPHLFGWCRRSSALQVANAVKEKSGRQALSNSYFSSAPLRITPRREVKGSLNLVVG